MRRFKPKRGGMLMSSGVARSIKSQAYRNNIVKLLNNYRNYLLKKDSPTPSDGSIVPHIEKHYTTFEDIDIDDGTKESIKNLKEELTNPIKWIDKLKGLYDKVTTELERKKLEKVPPTTTRNSADSFKTGVNPLASSLYIQGTSYGSSISQTSPYANTPKELTISHFNTPSKTTPTQLYNTPPKVKRDEKYSQSTINNDELLVQGTKLFPNYENSTPDNSPVKLTPGRVPVKSATRSPFSPSRIPPFRLP
jgi:hypothetical protein